MPGYELKMNSYDLGVDIELYDAMQRLRFEHPGGQGGGRHQRAGPDVLRRSQHPDAGAGLARLEGELLQVHQRDAQRHRGRDRLLGPDLHRGAERHRGRWRLRARAGLRPDRAGRRRLLGGVAAGGAAARGAARDRRPDPAWWTSGTCAGTGPTCSPPRPRACAARPRWTGGWSTRPCRAAGSRTRWRRRAEAAVAASTRPADGDGRRADPAGPHRGRGRHPLRPPRGEAWTGGPQGRHRDRGPGRSRRSLAGLRRPGRRLLAAGGGPGAGRPHPAAADQRAGSGHLGVPNPG